jgi:hypothetical protein
MFRRIISRNLKTTEVVVSKIFPAGCGWQYGSITATQQYCIPSDIQFALMCGGYEGLAVGMGHWTYMVGKKIVYDEEVDMRLETYKSLQFGTASMMSGIVWQPTVDFLRHDGFYMAATGTGLTCSVFFFGGLTLSKYLTCNKTNQVINIENTVKDALLSLSIGGATAMFVATDPLIYGNILKNIYGIGDTLDYNSIYMAGFSTASGFIGIQFIQNFNKNWIG